MAFGSSLSFTDILRDIGIGEGKRRRQEQKQGRREDKRGDLVATQGVEANRQERLKRLGLIRRQIGANPTLASGQFGVAGQPKVGRRRLTV